MQNYIILFSCTAKANRWSEDAANYPYHTISQQSPYHVSDGQSQQKLVFEHGLFNLQFVTLQNWNISWLSYGTLHSPVSTLTLTLCAHTLTTVNAT
jgi:hypothetical protein